MLVDFDRVEERNLGRQNFVREDLGKIKSEALAQRLCRRYDRPVGYSTVPIRLVELNYSGILVGCVDNGKARRDIESKILSLGGSYRLSNFWWVDTGNGENFGQVLIGNSNQAAKYYDEKTRGLFLTLPLPTIQRPDLLAQAPAIRLDCVANADQGPTINQTMAAVTVEVVQRMIAGTCHWIQLYIDMEVGSMTPVYATPDTVVAISKKRLEKEAYNG